MAFLIKPAIRVFQPVLIGMWGGSSSGKTYSALRLANGLVGPQGKIGVIDTENRRALFNAGEVGGQWDHLDFQPPFTPERLTEAFRTFETAGGYNCIIIDSVSHIWEGEGGVLDQADKNKSPGLLKWAAPKMALRRMINTLIRSQIHVIFCMRAKMGVAQDGRGSDAKIQSSGLEPIMEKGLIFEMLVSILLGPDQKPLFQKAGERYWVNHLIPAIKAPKAILQTIKPGEYITEATGEAILAWLNNATRDVQDEANRAASRGVDAFRAWWPSLTPEHKSKLKPLLSELQAKAAQADAEVAIQEGDESHDEPPTAFTGAPDEPFKDQFTPPTTARTEPTPPTEKSSYELSVERFEHGLGAVDWLYYMADDLEAEKRGKRGVDALQALAQTLGQAFVERFKAKQQTVYDQVQQAGRTMEETRDTLDSDPFNDGGIAPAATVEPNPVVVKTTKAARNRDRDEGGVTVF